MVGHKMHGCRDEVDVEVDQQKAGFTVKSESGFFLGTAKIR